MAFGGTGSMNIVLKNNRMLLRKREPFKRSLGGYSDNKTEYNLPQASPQLLRHIKQRMVEERRARYLKILVVLSLLIVTIVTFVTYLLT